MPAVKLDAMDRTQNVMDEVWQLTLRCYEADGVKQACLDLQDRHGIGVSALFALLSLTVLGHRLKEPSALATVLKRATHWQTSVIEPMRLARRNMRLAEGTNQEQARVDDLRQRLLRQEIEAEAVQQELLIHDFLPKAITVAATEAADLREAAAAYLDAFIPEPDTADQTAIDTIVAAFADQRS